MNTKTCSSCGKTLPATNEFFYTHPRSNDGLYQWCRECAKAAARVYYSSHRGSTEAQLVYWKDRYRARRTIKPSEPDPIDALSDTALAYIAGIVDGEGSLTIAFHTVRSLHQPVISISMTSQVTIEWLQKQLNTMSRSIVRANPKHKPQFQVRLTGRRAIKLARVLLPYMITKRGQAELFLEFETTYCYDGHNRVVPEYVELREQIKQTISQLNHA